MLPVGVKATKTNFALGCVGAWGTGIVFARRTNDTNGSVSSGRDPTFKQMKN